MRDDAGGDRLPSEQRDGRSSYRPKIQGERGIHHRRAALARPAKVVGMPDSGKWTCFALDLFRRIETLSIEIRSLRSRDADGPDFWMIADLAATAYRLAGEALRLERLDLHHALFALGDSLSLSAEVAADDVGDLSAVADDAAPLLAMILVERVDLRFEAIAMMNRLGIPSEEGDRLRKTTPQDQARERPSGPKITQTMRAAVAFMAKRPAGIRSVDIEEAGICSEDYFRALWPKIVAAFPGHHKGETDRGYFPPSAESS